MPLPPETMLREQNLDRNRCIPAERFGDLVVIALQVSVSIQQVQDRETQTATPSAGMDERRLRPGR